MRHRPSNTSGAPGGKSLMSQTSNWLMTLPSSYREWTCPLPMEHVCNSMHEWGYIASPLCNCGEHQTMRHIVNECPLTCFDGGISELHQAHDASFNWLLRRNLRQQLSHLSPHLSWPSPCAGPASIWVIQYFRSCAMSSVSWYFLMSPCMLSLHLFLGRPLFLFLETSSRSDFAQMWLGSRLKQWPNHFSLMVSRKVSTGFTWASFLMSSFLMWSNLVFPLAHLNILISAEFSLLSSFFFMAQNSEPYVIAGLMIVLKTLSFNSTGIFLSHITPDISFHFIHPIRILLLISGCEPPSLVNSDPRYFKDVTVGSSVSTIFTVVSV